MTTSIVDIFNTYKNQADNTFDSVATEYADLDIEWVVKDGNQTISANTSWGSATPDTRNLLVLVKGNLTVDAGYTLTAAARKRGMFIYVNGDLNLNGTISMTARGANAAGQRLLLCNIGSDYEVPAAGGAGGNGGSVNAGVAPGNPGTSGVATGACGGGGGGGAASYTYNAYGGNGSAGTSYSGGTGGGGGVTRNGGMTPGHAATNGGAGGNGAGNDSAGAASGGAGNPGGVPYTAGGTAAAGGDGTGGLLVVYIRGKLTVGANGKFNSLGTAGGSVSTGTEKGNGGGSGGGHIDVFYGSLTGSIAYTLTGGAAGSGGYPNGKGGDGSSRATQVSLPDLFGSKGGFGFGNPWIFLKDAYDRNKKLWTPKGLILPQDLGFSY